MRQWLRDNMKWWLYPLLVLTLVLLLLILLVGDTGLAPFVYNLY